MKTIKFVTCDEYKAYFKPPKEQSYRYVWHRDNRPEKWCEIKNED